MLGQIDFSARPVPHDELKAEARELMQQLVLLQQRAVTVGVPMAILFEGWEDAGKGSRINDLIIDLDARAFSVHVIGEPVGYESRLPFMARFWSKIGPHGHMTIFDQSWYYTAAQELLRHDDELHAGRHIKASHVFGSDVLREATHYFDSISSFEHQLAADGYVIVKFFVHITAREQAKRIALLAADPDTAWRVGDADYGQQENYDHLYQILDDMLEATDLPHSRWTVVNGEDKRSSNVAILRTIIDALLPAVIAKEAEAARTVTEKEVGGSITEGSETTSGTFSGLPASNFTAPELEPRQSFVPMTDTVTLRDIGSADQLSSRFKLVPIPTLDEVHHDLVLSDVEYKAQLKQVQKRLSALHQRLYLAKVPVLVAYEGWDAAGKGGNIKRLAQALDPRGYRIYPSPAPTPDELAHPFLWRYWTRLPRTGHIGIYDRTWYGRVLVERVEGFATTEEWQRAYDEINEFEEDMHRSGAVLVKFWVDVSPAEQLRRFEEREARPEKQWKITPDDWRNRGKNPLYRIAVDDMLRLTSTGFAPWNIIESDDKRYARVKALNVVADAIEGRLLEGGR